MELYNQFPFLLSATVNYHLESSASETALEVRKNLCLDNVLISTEGTEEALQKLWTIFEGAMNIREFLSNDIGFNGIIPDQDRTNLSARKILGIMWFSKCHIIHISMETMDELTNRTILQFASLVP